MSSDRNFSDIRHRSTCRRAAAHRFELYAARPGKVLVNPEYIDVERLPPILKKWDILIAPNPDPVDGMMSKISMCSPWTSINVLMLDEKRVIVDRSQVSFEPIAIPFWSYGPFGGSFHCATLDVTRRGSLQCYF